MEKMRIGSREHPEEMIKYSGLDGTDCSAKDSSSSEPHVNNCKRLRTDKLLLPFLICFSILLQSSSAKLFTNQFAVHVPAGEERAHQIATRHGFNNLGQVCNFYVISSS